MIAPKFIALFVYGLYAHYRDTVHDYTLHGKSLWFIVGLVKHR